MDKKIERILSLYDRLMDGCVINKAAEAERFGVNARSIQRDLDDLRAYFSEEGRGRTIRYNHGKRGYVLEGSTALTLSNSQIFAVTKILLESRSMIKDEMYPIIDCLVNNCVPSRSRQQVEQLIANERHHYLEPHHAKAFVETLWDMGSAVYEHQLLQIRYSKLKQAETVMRTVQPVGILFSEYYFYLCAYMCDPEDPQKNRFPYPTIYRIDRIEEYVSLNEKFSIPYAERFEEGEFRKRIQFMFGGELHSIRFRYSGLSLESVLDRFPTAKVVQQDEKGWEITAEVFGNGSDIWLRGQGDIVQML